MKSRQCMEFIFRFSASIMVFGSCIGALCGGIQSQKFGRKKSLLFDCFVFIVGTILCALGTFINHVDSFLTKYHLPFYKVPTRSFPSNLHKVY